MKLLYFLQPTGETIAVNPTHVMFVERYENDDEETQTIISTITGRIKIVDPFDAVCDSINRCLR